MLNSKSFLAVDFGAGTLKDVLAAADAAIARLARGVPLDGLAKETQLAFSPAAAHRVA